MREGSGRFIRPGRPDGTQSIHRAINLLVAVGENNGVGSRLKDLAERTGLHVSTTHRLLNALIWDGMVILDPISKRYYLGVRVHGLVDAARYGSVQPRVQSLLTQVSEATGTNAYFYLPLMNDIISVGRAEPSRSERRPGLDGQARYPLGIGAGGIAILAAWPEDAARRVIALNAQRYAEYGITSDTVLNAVRKAARVGYGLNEGVIPGVTGVGIVIHNSKGSVEAAVASVFQEMQLGKARIDQTVRILRQHIKAIEPLDYPGAPNWG
jgi:DNA-binding IclR family transcriptional regulator